ncbi:hypothetical protein V2J09_004612 [Rumex salicifolius]
MQGAKYSLLTVVCGGVSEDKRWQEAQYDHLEAQSLTSPSVHQLSKTLDSLRPNVVYFRGERLANDEIGSLRLSDVNLSTPEAISDLFGSILPTMVYLEIPDGEHLAEAIHTKGVPFVIFWKNSLSHYAASHFAHALFSVMQSTSCHMWDAFQLAHASFRLYCIRNNLTLCSNGENLVGNVDLCLLGDPPVIDVVMPEIEAGEDEDNTEGTISSLKIHDDEVSVGILVCGKPCSMDTNLLECLEDGLNALLNIEMRGSKLHNRFSAPPPPLQAATFSRGVVTMRCDVSTSNSAHISLLVSGSAQTCFDYQLLENHIKNEVIERSELVHAVSTMGEAKSQLLDPRKSASIASGATVFEVCMKVPSWALQVLRQLAPESSYRSLAVLGIASIQGLAVASFEKEDVDRLLSFSRGQQNDFDMLNIDVCTPPYWLRPPAPCQRRTDPGHGSSLSSYKGLETENHLITTTAEYEYRASRLTNGDLLPTVSCRQKLNAAAMRPIPHAHLRKMMPFTGFYKPDGHEGDQIKTTLPAVHPAKPSFAGSNGASLRKSSNTYLIKQVVPLNPLPFKKHGCGRAPIQLCSEEEFLKDVLQFLILRGHTRLIPQAGLAEFPDAILNSKRLDLFNLYREVVSRGGFHVGNGINWKGQIFYKMRNYTSTNRMTGVGNTLKRHYETYLLEYELAHEDVDGECCLLCNSSAAGDWVNCGVCGEWAHFGCDLRQGLGAFKDYAKTDGLEYICPQCSVSNYKKKAYKPSNGLSESLTYS